MPRNKKFSSQELQVEEWLKKANDDELNSRSILKHRDGAPIFLTSFYMPTRYPGDYPEFSWTDAEEREKYKRICFE